MINKLIYFVAFFYNFFICDEKKQNDFTKLHPVITVDYPFPTADKPQSKLFHFDNTWWAILPRSTGPSFWKRTSNGWIEIPGILDRVKGIPGRVDLFLYGNKITAVGVADSILTVFSLDLNSDFAINPWKVEIKSILFPPLEGTFETATIARDGNGINWVAAVSSANVYVWNSDSDGIFRNPPIILAKGIDEDDICVVTSIPGGVAVIWSDQIRDAVMIREHKDKNPVDIWEEETVIDQGNKTADDHLNVALALDGTLWLVSKNSVDEAGKPQFVLRIRHKEGKWVNLPYLNLESRMKRPSRPIVIVIEDNSKVFVGHGDNDRSIPYPHDAIIAFAIVDTSFSEVIKDLQPVIKPCASRESFIQNVTGPKDAFPLEGPWIILASDSNGNVYEADLRNMINR
jgi:hypothetical protein